MEFDYGIVRSGCYLHEVKLSLQQDCPSEVGLKSMTSRPNAMDSLNHLMWSHAFNVKPSEDKLHAFFRLKWKCPLKVSYFKWSLDYGFRADT